MNSTNETPRSRPAEKAATSLAGTESSYPVERPAPWRPETEVFADFIGYYQAVSPDGEINVKTLIQESHIPQRTVYRYMKRYREAGIASFRVRRAKRRRRGAASRVAAILPSARVCQLTKEAA